MWYWEEGMEKKNFIRKKTYSKTINTFLGMPKTSLWPLSMSKSGVFGHLKEPRFQKQISQSKNHLALLSFVKLYLIEGVKWRKNRLNCL